MLLLLPSWLLLLLDFRRLQQHSKVSVRADGLHCR
jgi:hypothetical protein